METLIRNARESDIPALYDIVQDAFAKYASNLGLPEKVVALTEGYEDIRQDLENPKKTVLIALLDGRPVGTIRYEILPNAENAYITRFGVRVDTQRSGVGQLLIDHVVERVRKQNVRILSLHSASKLATTVCFYYKMGFYIHSTSMDKGYCRALFLKELDHNVDVDLEEVMYL